MLTIPPELWIPMTKLAWEEGKGWADICYQFFRERMEIDILDIATQLKAITCKIENSVGTRK